MKTPVHLNALRAFEASARHQSFSAAADELNVTPAAIGQLVRTLESWLGAPLFHRSTSGKVRLVATEVAANALPDIRAGFDRLGMAMERLREGTTHGVLTVTVSPAFAAKWLLPRIEKFHEAWPDLDLRLDTNLKPVDFIAEGVDIGVRYGSGHWPGLKVDKLMDEEIYPVCAPELLRRNPTLKTLGGLATATLIHDQSMDSHTDFPSWETWFLKANITGVSTLRGLKINNSAAVLQAAIDGQGVAMARSVMAQDDLAAGRLIRLFPQIEFTSALAYYVVYRTERSGLPRLAAFRDWLLGEGAGQRSMC